MTGCGVGFAHAPAGLGLEPEGDVERSKPTASWGKPPSLVESQKPGAGLFDVTQRQAMPAVDATTAKKDKDSKVFSVKRVEPTRKPESRVFEAKKLDPLPVLEPLPLSESEVAMAMARAVLSSPA